jgi:predicted transcriptional regulator
MSYQRRPDGSFFDTVTGEILDNNEYQIVAIPRRIKIKEGWFMTFQDSLEVLATDKELSGQTFRVLMLMMSRLDFNNFIGVEQVELAQKLGIHRPDVTLAIRKLVAKGIIEKGPKFGKANTYKLNPLYGWKGRVKNLNEERKKRFSVVDGGKE